MRQGDDIVCEEEKDPGHHYDIYSLGATIYGLMVPLCPTFVEYDAFEGYDPEPICIHHEYSKRLRDLVKFCLELDSHHRPSIEVLEQSIEVGTTEYHRQNEPWIHGDIEFIQENAFGVPEGDPLAPGKVYPKRVREPDGGTYRSVRQKTQ